MLPLKYRCFPANSRLNDTSGFSAAQAEFGILAGQQYSD
jgi:hypothetical protein